MDETPIEAGYWLFTGVSGGSLASLIAVMTEPMYQIPVSAETHLAVVTAVTLVTALALARRADQAEGV